MAAEPKPFNICVRNYPFSKTKNKKTIRYLLSREPFLTMFDTINRCSSYQVGFYANNYLLSDYQWCPVPLNNVNRSTYS